MSAPECECERERTVRVWRTVGRELVYVGVRPAPVPRPEGAGESASAGEGER